MFESISDFKYVCKHFYRSCMPEKTIYSIGVLNEHLSDP